MYYSRENKMQTQKELNVYPIEQKNTNIIAGKHMYDLYPKITYNPEERISHKVIFTPKLLNHIDELGHLS